MSAPPIDFPVVSTYQDYLDLTEEFGTSEQIREFYPIIREMAKAAKNNSSLSPEQLNVLEKIDQLVQKKVFPYIEMAEGIEKKIAEGTVELTSNLTDEEAGVIFIAMQALEEIGQMFESINQ